MPNATPFKIAFIGNQTIVDSVMDELHERIRRETKAHFATHESVEVYVTKEGDFDLLAASAIKSAQEECPNKEHRLILVSPFEEANQGRRMEYYDGIVSLSETDARGEKAFKQETLRMAKDCQLLFVWDAGGMFDHIAHCVRAAKKAGVTVSSLGGRRKRRK